MTAAQRAHFSLLERFRAEGQVRAHAQRFEDPEPRESANNVKPVFIGHIRYESMTAAARELGCGRDHIYRMIRDKKARYE